MNRLDYLKIHHVTKGVFSNTEAVVFPSEIYLFFPLG